MKDPRTIEELPLERLRWRCKSKDLTLKTTNDVSPCEEIIGQKRALDALRLGLEVRHMGYNVFITGPVGTGRTTSVKKILEELQPEFDALEDICYVNNFKEPNMPRVIHFPAGQGRAFQRDMDNLIRALKRDVPKILESESYQGKRKEIIDDYQGRRKKMIQDLEKKVDAEGFSLVQVQMGPFVKPEVLPVVEENPTGFDQLEKLVDEGKVEKKTLDALKKKHQELSEEMQEVFKEAQELEKEMQNKLSDLETDAIQPHVMELISEIKKKYEGKKINLYLNEVQLDIMKDLSRFQKKSEESQPQQSPIPGLVMPQAAPTFDEYKVNVIVDNSETEGAPIMIETNPSYKNLFGTIERVMDRPGMWRTDFTKIQAGSLLRANGGFLVLNALDTLVQPGVWQALKRTLRNSIVDIESFDPFYMMSTSALKPEPINLKVKVVMIGDPMLYNLLYFQDPDFKKIFKVKADFDTVMPRDKGALEQYASFIRMICKEEDLRPFERDAVASITEYGVRMAGRQSKISTRFNVIADILRESNHWAGKSRSKSVSAEHVDRSIDEWIRRNSLPEDKIQELIEEDIIMIDTEGAVPGQVNGLSVYSIPEYTFGKPTRITAQTSMGRAGVINIEREADLSGRTHNKGVLILSGYLRSKYAQDKPLVMSASICFEQSYGGVDGDSASSTELYAILSSLSGIPIRQDLSVTGSVNQRGEIQPIGGVNQKIEGFFSVCKAKGLTGTQGVMIPEQNANDLMLKSEVLDAVSEGKFHIYPVRTVDEGIELLTGIPAGEMGEDGTYEEGTVHRRVDEKLRTYAEEWRKFGERL
jgi:ATP-dependent Lon protease